MKVDIRLIKKISIEPECLENFSEIIRTNDMFGVTRLWVAMKTYPNPKRRLIIPIKYLRVFYRYDIIPEKFVNMIRDTGIGEERVFHLMNYL